MLASAECENYAHSDIYGSIECEKHIFILI